jgi:hypothetical protein
VADLIMTWFFIISCSYIFWRIEPMVEKVSICKTPPVFLLIYSVTLIFILSGTLGAILYCFSGHQPTIHEVFFTAGIALALCFDRRDNRWIISAG